MCRVRKNEKEDTKLAIRDTRYEIRNTRYEIRNTRYEIRDTKYEIRNTRYEIRDTRYDLNSLRHPFRQSRIIRIADQHTVTISEVYFPIGMIDHGDPMAIDGFETIDLDKVA